MVGVEALARELRRASDSERTSRAYERDLDALFRRVFDDRGLDNIGDLRLLDDIELVLRDNNLEETYPDAFVELSERRALVAEAHSKMSAILDPTVSLRDLLYGILDSWIDSPARLELAFAPDEEEALERIRFGVDPPDQRLGSFLDRYGSLVEASSPALAQRIQSIIATELSVLMQLRAAHAVNALFAERGGLSGRALRLSIFVAPGTGDEFAANTVDEVMKMAVRQAVGAAFTLQQMPRQRSNVNWSIDEPTTFEGASIGLAAAVGVLSALQDVVIDPYSGFTGTVGLDGTVGAIEHVQAKVAAAAHLELRKVFVPTPNANEATQAAAGHALQVIGVNSVGEAWSLLTAQPRPVSPGATSLSAEVRRVELECAHAGLKVFEKLEREGNVQLKVTDSTTRGSMTVYQGKSGFSLVPGGQPGTHVHTLLTKIAAGAKRAPLAPAERLMERWAVPAKQDQARVEAALREVGSGIEKQESNCSYRIDFQAGAERVIARQFSSGTLTLQQISGGTESPLFFDVRGRIGAALGQLPGAIGSDSRTTRGEASLSNQQTTEVDPAVIFTGSWIGTDEAGKGDYFGPLVSAAVYVDDAIVEVLHGLGVRDSKKLSDKRVQELAAVIRDRVGGRYYRVVPLAPSAYNRLQEQFVKEGKTLTTLLAWAHARAIEDLLKRDAMTQNVLVDQFTDYDYIKAALLKEARTRDLNLVAVPRAEANIAVAAASILARDHYLTWMSDHSRRLGITLPKGASDAVVPVARELVGRFGDGVLGSYVKLHFRTTAKVLNKDG